MYHGFTTVSSDLIFICSKTIVTPNLLYLLICSKTIIQQPQIKYGFTTVISLYFYSVITSLYHGPGTCHVCIEFISLKLYHNSFYDNIKLLNMNLSVLFIIPQ